MVWDARVTTYDFVWTRQLLHRPTLRVAVFADLHACWPWMDTRQVRHLVAQTNALDADLILLLGDYSGHILGSVRCDPGQVSSVLAGLRAPLGVFAVFGNHDWRDDPDAVAGRKTTTLWHRAFEQAGIKCLNNAVQRIETDHGAFMLAGVDSQRAYRRRTAPRAGGADDFASVQADLDPTLPCILMAHEPDIFPTLPAQVDLTVSGHTHGGQILPFGKPWVVPSDFGTKYAYGRHRDGQKELIVSGGLGCSGLPIRYGCPPELVVVEVT